MVDSATKWVVLAIFGFIAIGLLRSDGLRLIRPSIKVRARVVGFRESRPTRWLSRHRAIFAFEAEGAEHEVLDQVRKIHPELRVGDEVELHYPEGSPELARISRPALQATGYVFMIIALAGMWWLMGGRNG